MSKNARAGTWFVSDEAGRLHCPPPAVLWPQPGGVPTPMMPMERQEHIQLERRPGDGKISGSLVAKVYSNNLQCASKPFMVVALPPVDALSVGNRSAINTTQREVRPTLCTRQAAYDALCDNPGLTQLIAWKGWLLVERPSQHTENVEAAVLETSKAKRLLPIVALLPIGYKLAQLELEGNYNKEASF